MSGESGGESGPEKEYEGKDNGRPGAQAAMPLTKRLRTSSMSSRELSTAERAVWLAITYASVVSSSEAATLGL